LGKPMQPVQLEAFRRDLGLDTICWRKTADAGKNTQKHKSGERYEGCPIFVRMSHCTIPIFVRMTRFDAFFVRMSYCICSFVRMSQGICIFSNVWRALTHLPHSFDIYV
jgi:hypothetical protein